MLRKIPVFLFTLIIFIVSATYALKSDTLQNGKNGYDGCVDTYIAYDKDDPYYEDLNYGNDQEFMAKDCPT